MTRPRPEPDPNETPAKLFLKKTILFGKTYLCVGNSLIMNDEL